MSEPESLATPEPLAAHIARHAYDCLLMLSDGVFAIATTLAALEIRLPEGIHDPLPAFEALARPVAVYAISFVVIAIFWTSHRELFARVQKVTRGLTALTLAFLFAISLIPLGVGGIAEHQANAGFRVYAVTMMTCGLLNAALWNYASFAPGVMRPEVPKGERIERAIGWLAMPILFVPIMLLPITQMSSVTMPLVIVVLILRRIALPRYIRRRYPLPSAPSQGEA